MNRGWNVEFQIFCEIIGHLFSGKGRTNFIFAYFINRLKLNFLAVCSIQYFKCFFFQRNITYELLGWQSFGDISIFGTTDLNSQKLSQKCASSPYHSFGQLSSWTKLFVQNLLNISFVKIRKVHSFALELKPNRNFFCWIFQIVRCVMKTTWNKMKFNIVRFWNGIL